MNSTTQAALASPSISTRDSYLACNPPAFGSALTTFVRTRIRAPTFTGLRNRTRSDP